MVCGQKLSTVSDEAACVGQTHKTLSEVLEGLHLLITATLSIKPLMCGLSCKQSSQEVTLNRHTPYKLGITSNTGCGFVVKNYIGHWAEFTG